MASSDLLSNHEKRRQIIKIQSLTGKGLRNRPQEVHSCLLGSFFLLITSHFPADNVFNPAVQLALSAAARQVYGPTPHSRSVLLIGIAVLITGLCLALMAFSSTDICAPVLYSDMRSQREITFTFLSGCIKDTKLQLLCTYKILS